MAGPSTIFDRQLLRRRRDRAAGGLEKHDFLLREVSERLVDRIDDVRRSFSVALDLGCRRGALADALVGQRGIETLVQCDLSCAMAAAAPGLRVVADEEMLPFAKASFDLVVSSMSLHWVNDLPGTLIQIRQALRPDGLFLAAMLGGDTLQELRRVLTEAEIEADGGLSPRVSPFADVRDMGNLLQRAGFALPVADIETITVSYGQPLALLADLRGMGETNAVVERRRAPTRRSTLWRAMRKYQDMYGDPQGRVPATFQVIFLSAWAPDPSQPKALRPGSAAARLAEALGTREFVVADPTAAGRSG